MATPVVCLLSSIGCAVSMSIGTKQDATLVPVGMHSELVVDAWRYGTALCDASSHTSDRGQPMEVGTQYDHSTTMQTVLENGHCVKYHPYRTIEKSGHGRKVEGKQCSVTF